MVLESLVNPLKAETKPLDLIFLGMLYATIGLFLSLWIFNFKAITTIGFEQVISVTMIAFTALVSTPLMYSIIKYEEGKDIIESHETTLLKEHAKAVEAYLSLFIGFFLAYTLWFIILPYDNVRRIYSLQMVIIEQTSLVMSSLFYAKQLKSFSIILLNNIKVLFVSLIFSLLYGLGAIFIVAWNAAILGTAVGNTCRQILVKLASKVGGLKLSHYFHAFALSVDQYLLHGLIEVAAYIIAAIAGGILSMAIIRGDIKTPKFATIIKDVLVLVIISLSLLFIAALVEVFVTPVVF